MDRHTSKVITNDERFLGDLLVKLYDAVEDKCDTDLIDEIVEDAGWAAVVGTVAGIREHRDLERETNSTSGEGDA